MTNGATKPPQGLQKCKSCPAVGPPCAVCHGTGKTSGATCQSCKGTGLAVHTTIIQSCKG